MASPRQQRIYNRKQLFRLLAELLDNEELSSNFFFKGGTCCFLLDYLDRFSMDLDFDLRKGANKKKLREECHSIFDELDLKIKDESKEALQFFLKYQAPPGERSTIKLEILDNPYQSIDYETKHLEDIDRTAICQTLESIFANKLVALTDRYEKRGTVAGRDVYDIHHFFSHNYDYKEGIIEERTGQSAASYLEALYDFIKEKVTQKVIDEDLNFLLSDKKFQAARKSLRQETLVLIKDEIEIINENV